MAEPAGQFIDPEEIARALRKHVEGFEPETEREEVGQVMETGDGIARVQGLPGAMALELLEFPGETFGLAFNLEVDEIGCVILGEAEGIEQGDPVKRTGRVLSVGVGDGVLGRVIDPLGRPMDGKGAIRFEEQRVLEMQAPSVVNRQPVNEPLQTGIKAVDAMTPIGRGQRELIIGDRQTGKTAVAVDAIINQRENWATGDPKKQVKCVYVAIGQKASTIAEVVGALEENGALEYTVVVNASASVPSSLKFIAPYAGSAIGQHWMYRGEHALIVFDDLSKQADAYREIALLLRRPPGREAYPGDVFYLHSRLLERCAKLSDDLGGGSLTGLPIVETKGGDVSAYIPTNVISITDGQIYLEIDLFNSGVRPAINVGISVSRVGGNAQIKAMKQVAGRLRLDLAQFRELEAFAEFGSELDKASQSQLERGARVVEVLKQLQYSPMSVEKQVLSIYAVTNGYLDEIPVEDSKRFEEELLEYLETRHSEIGRHVAEKGDLPDKVEEKLKKALDEFRKQFSPSEEKAGTKAKSEGGPVDKLREDVGWDRVGEEVQPESPEGREAVERADIEEPGGGREERDKGALEREATEENEGTTEEIEDEVEEVDREGGPAGDTRAQPPG
jgi:F-type H+-transporting ATPase subunit alpha